MKIKSNKEAKTILKKINKFGGSKLPDIKYIIKLWELKHCGIGTRLANVEQSTIESNNPKQTYTCYHFTSNKSGMIEHWQMYSFFQ